MHIWANVNSSFIASKIKNSGNPKHRNVDSKKHQTFYFSDQIQVAASEFENQDQLMISKYKKYF